VKGARRVSTNPYDILGLGSEATEAEIRQQYLTLVRQHPPDRDPERFAAIRAAYDQLRDPVTSLEHRLFDVTSHETLESLLARERAKSLPRRIATDVLLSLADE
jgi:DnaJ-class molecular chaperone